MQAPEPAVAVTASPRPPLRFAVLSDPHAVSGSTYRHETWAQEKTRHDPRRNPFAAIKEMIRKSEVDGELLRADALLCPGDLTNRVDAKGLEYAWEELLEIGSMLGVERTIATTGNHDVIRGEDLPEDADDDAWVAALLALKPVYPTEDSAESEVYFADDYTVVTADRWRVVAVNSCARHATKNEFRHGKIDEKTLQELEAVIPGDRKDVNILLCHHHPVPWAHMAADDTGHMRGGDKLLSLLETRDPSRWVFLHGHRHVPALGYTGQSSSGAVRFSAGSLARSLTQEERSHVRNQFYVLEFDTEELAALELTMGGRFRSWDWNYSVGMQPANEGYGLPPEGGFGFRRDAHDLAARAKQRADDLGQRSVTWPELEGGDRRWRYVAPTDRETLRTALEAGQANVEPADGGSVIKKVGFPP